jgi:hypothetical protein
MRSQAVTIATAWGLDCGDFEPALAAAAHQAAVWVEEAGAQPFGFGLGLARFLN